MKFERFNFRTRVGYVLRHVFQNITYGYTWYGTRYSTKTNTMDVYEFHIRLLS